MVNSQLQNSWRWPWWADFNIYVNSILYVRANLSKVLEEQTATLVSSEDEQIHCRHNGATGAEVLIEDSFPTLKTKTNCSPIFNSFCCLTQCLYITLILREQFTGGYTENLHFFNTVPAF